MFHVIRTQPKWLVVVECVALVLLVAWIDYITGEEVTVGFLYMLPILLASWNLGRTSALLFAFFSLMAWWALYDRTKPFDASWKSLWALLNRVGYFAFFAIGGSALKGRQEADRARIETLERKRELEREIVRVSEREQRRIGQDLHDGLCQHLAAIGCAAHSLADDLDARMQPEAKASREIEHLLDDAVIQTRQLASGIFPAHITGYAGLSVALEALASAASRYSSLRVSLKEHGEQGTGDPESAIHFYRIAQEALNNAIRHSGAQNVSITLNNTVDGLMLAIEDDGTGLPDPLKPGGGMGLSTMRYRARLLGTDLQIGRGAEGGLKVVCQVRHGVRPDNEKMP